MEKYYDLIVSLIKANRKYSGCEALLDEIAEDVYAHAEVVLNTVTNESVITSYLNKIVTTSIITVPRKLGIQVKKQRYSDNADTVRECTEQESVNDVSIDIPDAQEQEENTVLSTLDSTEASESSDEITEFELETADDIEAEDEELAEDEQFEEIIENELEITEDDLEIDELSETPQEDIQEDIIESTEEIPEDVILSDESKVQEVDKTLVDKMINGVQNESELLEEDNELLQCDEEILSDLDENEILSVGETDEVVLSDEEIVDLDLLEETSFLPDETTDKSDVKNVKLPSYDCFEFQPEQRYSADYENIMTDINEAQTKHPKLDIIGIFKLRYQEKLSVEEISKRLNITEDDVLNGLDELVNIVKE